MNSKLEKINKVLKNTFGTEIDFNSSIKDLRSVVEYYSNFRNQILQEEAFNSYHINKEYTKALLIMEAIQIFLSEVAPKRSKKLKSMRK